MGLDKRGQSTGKLILNVLGGICYGAAGGAAILQQIKLAGLLIAIGSVLIAIGQFV